MILPIYLFKYLIGRQHILHISANYNSVGLIHNVANNENSCLGDLTKCKTQIVEGQQFQLKANLYISALILALALYFGNSLFRLIVKHILKI